MMKLTTMTLLCLATLGLQAGCNRAESPSTTAKDVADARHDAAKDNAEAQKDAAKDVAKAENGMQDKASDVAKAESKGNYEIAETQAKGDHKVALEKCEALSGDQQKACKSQADANFEQATANAKSAYPNH